MESKALCALLTPLPLILLCEIIMSCIQIKRQAKEEYQASKERKEEINGSMHSKITGKYGDA